MPVKKVRGNSAKVTAAKARVKAKSSNPDLSCLTLPDEMKDPDPDFSNYTTLVYGREKIGKTTLAASFPKALFFPTEPGIKGMKVYAFNWEHGGVTDWSIFRRGVELVSQNPGKFKTVIIDTVDVAYDQCLDWVCANLNIPYPGVDASGDQDYGKSWRAVKQEFVAQIMALVRAGVGVLFISHAKEQENKTRSGERYTRIFPSMGNQARTVVESLVDFFFYAEYMVDVDGNTQRVLICEGDELIWAGAREGLGGMFPKFVALERSEGYKTLEAAFRGTYKGINPTDLRITKATSKTGQQFLSKQKAEASKEKLKGGATKKGKARKI